MAYIPSSPEEEQFLKNFDPTQYLNPGVAADTALFAVDEHGLSILLIRRGGWPYQGCWALPGGFVNLDEDILDSAARELEEETGIACPYVEQVFVWGRPDRDPRERVITVSFTGLIDRGQALACAGDDAAQAEWFRLSGYTCTEKDGMTQASYTLTGVDTISPVVAWPNGQLQRIAPVQNGGLAFDHAESIAYSFEYIRRRAREGLLELSFSEERMKGLARKALML